MAEMTLLNPAAPAPGRRIKFIIGGMVLLGAVAYLIVSGLATQGEYFVTVDELHARQAELQASARPIRVSGAVIGDTISFDGQTLAFTVAHVPTAAADIEAGGGLAEVLHQAVNDPQAQQLQIVMEGEPLPELLQHEAQAIVTGRLGPDGVFYAEELLLKCPTRYEEAVPQQVAAQ